MIKCINIKNNIFIFIFLMIKSINIIKSIICVIIFFIMIKSINIKNSIICVIIIFIVIIIKSLDVSTPKPKLGLDASTRNPKFTLDIFLMLSSSLYSCFLSSEVPASLIKIILFSLDYSIRVSSFRVFPAMAPALSYRRSLILINIKSLREEEWNISVYHS